MRRGKAAISILNLVQVLDQEIATPWFIAEQGKDIFARPGRSGALLASNALSPGTRRFPRISIAMLSLEQSARSLCVLSF